MMNEVNNPVFINNLVANTSVTMNNVVNETIQEVIKQKPFIVKQIKCIAPLIKELHPPDNSKRRTIRKQKFISKSVYTYIQKRSMGIDTQMEGIC